MAYFDFDGAIDVSIQPNAAAFPSLDKVEVRPLSYGIQPAVQGGVINLTLSEPRNLVIQVNGDIFNVLHLFLNRIEDDPITAEQAANDSSIVYFAPGYHALNGGKGTVNVTSGQTVYFAQGAVVNGAINIQNVSDVSVRGRGLVYKTSNTLSAFLIESSHNVLIDGIVVLNPGYYSIMAGQVQGVTVRNFRSISATTYGDGIDFFCSKDVLVERVFMRNSDDCIALYQHRWNYYGDSGNITIRDSSLWADVAHPINIGTHGNADSPETMDGVMIANIDVLDHREPQVGYQGCVAISAGDENTIQNVLVDGVRVEDFRDGMLFNFRVNYNPSYNAAPGRAIRNVTVRNLSYQGTRANMPVVNGYSDDRRVEFVDFQNLTINGAHIWDGMKKPTWYLTGDTIPMFIGAHVNNFTFSS
ncbi:pectin lyase-like protein [Thozetella sp. PMI_491]|nr:pectin lyase-like protein [Thozetella sp. PMI_491]